MTTVRMFSTAIVSVFVVSLGLAAPKPSAVKATLQGKYNQLDHAFRVKKLGILKTMLDDRFTATDPMGNKVGKAAIIKDFTGMSHRAKSITWPRKVTSITLQKGEAVVMVSGMFTAMFPTAKGPAQKMQLQATNRDVWVNHHGKWQILKSVILHRTAYMNGKPMNMPTHPVRSSRPS